MKLFQVYNVHTNKLSPITDDRNDLYTEAKAIAKAARDAANGGLCTDPDSDKKWNKDKGWRVTYGPDHWRYKS